MTEIVPVTRTPRAVKLRVEDYLALDRLGAFDIYGKTELIEGEIVYMNAQHRAHARIKSRLHVLLATALAELGVELEALVEGSVTMPPHNVPEPDIAITADPEGDGLIPLASLAMVVEVADTTLRSDLGLKQRIYARQGVPEYWVVDVKAGIVHQMWSPDAGRYREKRVVGFGERIAAASITGLAIETATL